jgi:TPR repeat protein
MYENGEGTRKNLRKAKELYEKVAEDDTFQSDAIKAKEALERIKNTISNKTNKD